MGKFPLVLIFLVTIVFPQGDTGQLSGTVVDHNGATILGASANDAA